MCIYIYIMYKFMKINVFHGRHETLSDDNGDAQAIGMIHGWTSVGSSWFIGFPIGSSHCQQTRYRNNSRFWYLINPPMVFRSSSCLQEVFLTSSGLNPLVKTTSSKPVHWPESHTTWFMGLLLVHGEQIQANMRDNPKYCKPFNSRSIYHRSLVISQHLEVSYNGGAPKSSKSWMTMT